MVARQEDLGQVGFQPALFTSNGEAGEDMRRGLRDVIDVGEEGGIKPEEKEVTGIRPVKLGDLLRVLSWFSDADTRNHLSPLPDLPEDWSNGDQLMVGQYSLAKYYDNDGESKKITPLAAVNKNDKALGVLTVRWKGDPYIDPKKHRIASIERVLVEPELRREGVGKKLVEKALEVIFDERKYPEVRLWVMTDEIAPGWGGIVEFFAQFGFRQIKDEDVSWAKYQEVRGIKPDGRDAWWFKMEKEEWEAYKKKKSAVQIQQLRLISEEAPANKQT